MVLAIQSWNVASRSTTLLFIGWRDLLFPYIQRCRPVTANIALQSTKEMRALPEFDLSGKVFVGIHPSASYLLT